MEPKPRFKWTISNNYKVFHLSCVDLDMCGDPDIAIFRSQYNNKHWLLVEDYWQDSPHTITSAEGNDGFWELLEKGKRHWLYCYANR